MPGRAAPRAACSALPLIAHVRLVTSVALNAHFFRVFHPERLIDPQFDVAPNLLVHMLIGPDLARQDVPQTIHNLTASSTCPAMHFIVGSGGPALFRTICVREGGQA